jgi:putative nucleotidyltransferase with HDIG domain
MTQSTPRIVDAVDDVDLSRVATLLDSLKLRHLATFEHSRRVVWLSLRLASEHRLDETQMRSLALGSLLHDIGKLRLPGGILSKRSGLSNDEWASMRLHPQHGVQMLRGIGFLEEALCVVEQHHEKWDGSGYPFGLSGEDINLNARILTVVDAFDAMCDNRAYSRRFTFEEASAELQRCAGTHFDPALVEAFHRIDRREWEELRWDGIPFHAGETSASIQGSVIKNTHVLGPYGMMSI